MGHVLVAVPHRIQTFLALLDGHRVLFYGLGQTKVSHFFRNVPYQNFNHMVVEVNHPPCLDIYVERLSRPWCIQGFSFPAGRLQVLLIQGLREVGLGFRDVLELEDSVTANVFFFQTLLDHIFNAYQFLYSGDTITDVFSLVFCRPLPAKFNSLEPHLLKV